MDRSFAEAFDGRRSKILDVINVDEKLLIELQDRRVISSHQTKLLRNKYLHPTSDERTAALLDILEKRDEKLFPLFIEALIRADQQHVVDTLLSPSDDISVRQRSSSEVRDTRSEDKRSGRLDDSSAAKSKSGGVFSFVSGLFTGKSKQPLAPTNFNEGTACESHQVRRTVIHHDHVQNVRNHPSQSSSDGSHSSCLDLPDVHFTGLRSRSTSDNKQIQVTDPKCPQSAIVSLSEYNKITTILDPPSVKQEQLSDFVKIVFPFILQRVKMRGCTALYASNIAKLVQSCPISDQPVVSGEFRDRGSAKSRAQSRKSGSVSKLDCMTYLLRMVDNVVAHDLLLSLSQFPIAIPLVLQNWTDKRYKVTAPLLRGIVVKWETGSGRINEHSLLHDAFRLVVAVRLGTNKIGKSSVLNQLFRTDNMFSSKEESTYDRPRTLDGAVEMIWLTRETCKDEFYDSVVSEYYRRDENEILLLANLHGDANQHPEILALLNRISCTYLVFAMPDCGMEQYSQFLVNIDKDRAAGIPKLYVDDKDEEDSLEDIQTGEITTRKTMHKVCQAIKSAFMNCPIVHEVKIPEVPKASHLLEMLSPIENQCCHRLIDIIKRHSCKEVKTAIIVHNRHGRNYFVDGSSDVRESIDVLRSVVLCFSDMLNQDIRDVQAAVIHLEKELIQISYVESREARQTLMQVRMRLTNTADDRLTVSNGHQKPHDEMHKAMSNVNSSCLGLEHIFRGLGTMYGLALHKKDVNVHSLVNSDDTRLRVLRTPKRVASLFTTGQSIELLDGDSMSMGEVWLSAVCCHVEDKFPKLRVYVVSIIGLQSSGKSTLLNSLFACRFPVSVGSCTHGVFMRLLFLDKELCKTHDYDAILLIDTQGLGSPEKMNDSELGKIDRRLATFAISISNLTIINILGENMNEIAEILQIAIIAMTRLEETGISPDIYAVQHLLCERNEDKCAPAQAEFIKAIKRATSLVKEKNFDVGAKKADLVDLVADRIEKGSHLIQFHPYKDGATSNSPPAVAYQEDVIKLYDKILEVSKSCKTIKPFTLWHKMVEGLWECAQHENFSLRFRNIKEIYDFFERNSKLTAVKLAYDDAFRYHMNNLEAKLTANQTQEEALLLQTAKDELWRIPADCHECKECSMAKELYQDLCSLVKDQMFMEDSEATVSMYLNIIRERKYHEIGKILAARTGRQKRFEEVEKFIYQEVDTRIKEISTETYSNDQRAQTVEDILHKTKQTFYHVKSEKSIRDRMEVHLVLEYSQIDDVVDRFNTRVEFSHLCDKTGSIFPPSKKIINRIKKTFSVSTSREVTETAQLRQTIEKLPEDIFRVKQVDRFEDGMVAYTRKSINEILENDDKKFKRLNAQTKTDLHILAQQLLCDHGQKMQQEWDKKNTVTEIIAGNEQHFRQLIDTLLVYGYDAMKHGNVIAGQLLCAIRNKAITDENRMHIMHVLHLNWTSSTAKVRLKYFGELAREVQNGKKDRALSHFSYPKCEVEEWFRLHVDAGFRRTAGLVFRKTYDQEFQTVFEHINNAQSMQALIMIVQLYLPSNDPRVIHPSETTETGFSSVKDTVLKMMQKWKEQYTNVTETDFCSPSRDSDVMSLLGCTDQCRVCGALCWGHSDHINDAGETSKHFTCHQPVGLIGCVKDDSKQLYPLQCHNIKDDRLIWTGSCNDAIPWPTVKQSVDGYKDWKYTPHYNSKFDELMRWFFTQLHGDIAARMSLVPALPEDLHKYDCDNSKIEDILRIIDLELNA